MWDTHRVVPFVPPSPEDRKMALGSLAGQKFTLKKSLIAILPLFIPQGPSKPGDWLHQYEEDGQPFEIYKSIDKKYINKDQIIYIGLFQCGLPKQTTKLIRNKSRAFFHGQRVKLHHMKGIDLKTLQPITKGDQVYYNGRLMNKQLSNRLPKDGYCMTVITSLFLYNPKNLQLRKFKTKEQQDQWNTTENWVFGLASIKDRTGCISLAKIRQEITLSEQQFDQQQILSRVVNHELCHNFSIKHCIYYQCLMNGSNGMHQGGKKFIDLCPICIRKLQHNMGFSLLQRYRELQKFGNQFYDRAVAAIESVVDK